MRPGLESEINGGARHSSPDDGEHFHGQVSGILADKCLPLRLVRPLLKAWAASCEQLLSVDKEALAIAAQDDSFQRMISVPGGAITALAFKATINHSWRFSSYANVGAYLGLAPRCYASGETDRAGRISKCGDRLVLTYQVEAAGVLLTLSKPSDLKGWGLRLAKRASAPKARRGPRALRNPAAAC